ncbi:sulfur carrier protein ThiS [Sinomicrobium pectinilyticum]|uniref:Sulfur carrier protein ThiS n=1 Tax=Sinomicrobium pectinilyticum TaxID=1084421 RepID=A0A3N0D410_SINP1|nr:sulfur carrier protein ThiS [Sinomicrobium pectinilyticum]RNL69993.1 sulfur carrier protein ThiS [Sinomicrobium pectinilyticum]
METITVNVNDKAVSLASQSTITDLIQHMAIPPQGIAIALSSSSEEEFFREIIPQKQWTTYILSDKQDILIIKATQGG